MVAAVTCDHVQPVSVEQRETALSGAVEGVPDDLLGKWMGFACHVLGRQKASQAAVFLIVSLRGASLLDPVGYPRQQKTPL